ncbi:hypothetical protein RIF29_18511 [Crotalaria pallida]|uniref:Uncharacterized protein n=1 Tax=Crotalaria pallida TaxID=3830 RepID=A0AAN9IHF4_CROPI
MKPTDRHNRPGEINKSYLPLISGELSIKNGVIIVSSSLIMLPFLRWKRYPVLTALNSVADLAIVKPLGYFLHMQDIPDMEGDSKFGIQSLSLRLGQKQVFWICVSLLQMAYGVAILVGMTSPFLWSKVSMGLGHGILASLLWYHAKSVDMKSIDAFQSFYAFLWKDNLLVTDDIFLFTAIYCRVLPRTSV